MEGHPTPVENAAIPLGHGWQLGGGAACFSPALPPPPPTMLDKAFTFVYGEHVAKDKGEHMTTFDDLPLFRSTDPQGSRNGAKHIAPKRGSQAMRLLAIFAENPIMGCTDEEAGLQAGILHSWKRCSDLRRMGFIEDAGQMRKTSSGVMAMVCRITQQGLEALK